MPTIERNTAVIPFPMPRRGVSTYKSLTDMHPEEAVKMQNCFYRNGVVKRRGYTKRTETNEMTEVSTGNKILGLHRFYFGTSSHTIAVSDTDVKYWDGSAWQNIDTARTTGKNTLIDTWGALDKCYICNGTDEAVIWDGSSAQGLSVAYAGAARPSKPVQMLSYSDRLLCIDAGSAGNLVWSKSYVDNSWEVVGDTNVRADVALYGMIIHSENNSSSGGKSSVLLAGARDMYLFNGNYLDPLSIVQDYELRPLGLNVGCQAPKTMVHTEAGSIWLGTDKQVYLLTFDSLRAIPIGHKIQSNLDSVAGILDLPSGQIVEACAIYHDGFYKLSFAGAGETTNTLQYWLDVKRMRIDEDGFWGPWFGPMTGMTFSVMATQNGPGDGGELLAGESDASKGSYVYHADQSNIWADDGENIPVRYQSFYNPLTTEFVNKDVDKLEFDLYTSNGSVSVNIHDFGNDQLSATSYSLTPVTGALFGTAVMGTDVFAFSGVRRLESNVSPTVKVRRMSLEVGYDNTGDKFELYGMKAKAFERAVIFEE